jgi:hypothetical protein
LKLPRKELGKWSQVRLELCEGKHVKWRGYVCACGGGYGLEVRAAQEYHDVGLIYVSRIERNG